VQHRNLADPSRNAPPGEGGHDPQIEKPAQHQVAGLKNPQAQSDKSEHPVTQSEQWTDARIAGSEWFNQAGSISLATSSQE
jgi:hypothetical protein